MSDRDADEEFRALMEGLRTTLPGAQVLFAFLLTAPLQPGFSDLTSVQQLAFYAAFGFSAIATLLLIAPSVHQRVRAPLTGIPRRSHEDVATAVHLATAGTIGLGIAVTAAIFFVTSLMFEFVGVLLATGVVLALMVWAWFYLPLVTFRRRDPRDPVG